MLEYENCSVNYQTVHTVLHKVTILTENEINIYFLSYMSHDVFKVCHTFKIYTYYCPLNEQRHAMYAIRHVIVLIFKSLSLFVTNTMAYQNNT